MLRASDLSVGMRARILSLDDAPLSRRLAEMGCVPQTVITLKFKAPAGDPMAFDIDGYLLGLRRNEAQHILVEEVKDGH